MRRLVLAVASADFSLPAGPGPGPGAILNRDLPFDE
jgi:hypothetical protein